MLVKIFNHVGFEVKIAKCATILDALDTDADFAKHPHLDSRETHFFTLKVCHLDTKFSYQ